MEIRGSPNRFRPFSYPPRRNWREILLRREKDLGSLRHKELQKDQGSRKLWQQRSEKQESLGAHDSLKADVFQEIVFVGWQFMRGRAVSMPVPCHPWHMQVSALPRQLASQLSDKKHNSLYQADSYNISYQVIVGETGAVINIFWKSSCNFKFRYYLDIFL